MDRQHEKYQRLIDYCKALQPTPTAVVHPCDQSSLQSAVEAAKMGLIAPVLVGPSQRWFQSVLSAVTAPAVVVAGRVVAAVARHRGWAMPAVASIERRGR